MLVNYCHMSRNSFFFDAYTIRLKSCLTDGLNDYLTDCYIAVGMFCEESYAERFDTADRR